MMVTLIESGGGMRPKQRSPATVLYRNGANSHKVLTFEDERKNTTIAFSIFLSILRESIFYFIKQHREEST